MPPSSEGGSQVTVILYNPMEGKARFSGLPGGAGGGVEWDNSQYKAYSDNYDRRS